MTYYQSTFGSHMNFNLGLLFTIVLVALLIFLELDQPLLRQSTISVLGRLRLRFSTVTWILFIIFMGIFYTSVIMILTTRQKELGVNGYHHCRMLFIRVYFA